MEKEHFKADCWIKTWTGENVCRDSKSQFMHWKISVGNQGTAVSK